MTQQMALQLLGYTASILIAVSLLMRSIVRLRTINLVGAAMFSLYGFLIGSYPVGLLNLLTATINVVQLLRLARRREIFRVLEIRPDAPYLHYFLTFQDSDIRRFFPRFLDDITRNPPWDLALFVLRDLVPAGVLLGNRRGGTLEVVLDYVIPQYRDTRVGRFLFVDEADYFRRRGIREIVSPADTPIHADYLTKMGFSPAGDGRMFVLRLADGRES